MTRRTDLPSQDDVQAAITTITETTGKPPSVLTVAGRLGLANTTFRRHFPDIAQDLTATSSRPGTEETDTTGYATLKHHNAKLRRDNQELTEHLELTIAHIQRLTLDVHQLRQQLETATKITRIGPATATTTRAR